MPALKINSFLELKKWLEQDLLDLSETSVPVRDIRNKLIDILQNLDSNVKADHFRQQIHEMLITAVNASDMSFLKHLQQIYFFIFFQENSYRNLNEYFTMASSETILLERLKYDNRLPTLDYILLVSDDPRDLSQTDRACVISKAALDLYMLFRKEHGCSQSNANLLDSTSHKYFFCNNYFTRTII